MANIKSSSHKNKVLIGKWMGGWGRGEWFLSNGLLLLSDCEETLPKHCHHCYAVIAATQLILHSTTAAQPVYSGLIKEVTWCHRPAKPPSTTHHRCAGFISQHGPEEFLYARELGEVCVVQVENMPYAPCNTQIQSQHLTSGLSQFSVCFSSFIVPMCWESSMTSTTETRIEMPSLFPFLQQASEVLSSFGKLPSRIPSLQIPCV